MENLGDIKAAVASALARSDVPDYVYTLAQTEINARFRVREMEVTATLSVEAGSIYVDLPTGFKLMRHAYIGEDGTAEGDAEGGAFDEGFSEGFDVSDEASSGASVYTKLEQVTGWSVSHEFVESACPTAFAIVGTKMRLNATPDTDYTIVYTAVVAPAELVAAEDTNAMLAAFPSLYLYGALRHAAVWAQDVEMAQVYTAAYEGEALRIIKADRVGRYGSPLASRNG